MCRKIKQRSCGEYPDRSPPVCGNDAKWWILSHRAGVMRNPADMIDSWRREEFHRRMIKEQESAERMIYGKPVKP